MAAGSSDTAEVQVRLLTSNHNLTRNGDCYGSPRSVLGIPKNIFEKKWRIFNPPPNGRQPTIIHHEPTTTSPRKHHPKNTHFPKTTLKTPAKNAKNREHAHRRFPCKARVTLRATLLPESCKVFIANSLCLYLKCKAPILIDLGIKYSIQWIYVRKRNIHLLADPRYPTCHSEEQFKSREDG
jgi:hypothetical protein